MRRLRVILGERTSPAALQCEDTRLQRRRPTAVDRHARCRRVPSARAAGAVEDTFGQGRAVEVSVALNGRTSVDSGFSVRQHRRQERDAAGRLADALGGSNANAVPTTLRIDQGNGVTAANIRAGGGSAGGRAGSGAGCVSGRSARRGARTAAGRIARRTSRSGTRARARSAARTASGRGSRARARGATGAASRGHA
jgi:hypothetical protein